MRVDNISFASFNESSSKQPIYVIGLSFDNDNTDILWLTSHAEAEAPDAAITAGEVIYNVVKGISGQSQVINPITSISTIGAFNFSVVDINNAVTVYIRDKLDNGDGLRHKRIVLYVGYEGMLWDDYQLTLTYLIDGISTNNKVHKFKCSDIQRQERKKIFEPQVRNLSKTVTAIQSHIPVLTSDLTEFPVIEHDSSYTDLPSTNVGYALIEDEVVSHSGLFTHSTDGTSLNVINRGALNTKATEHVFNATSNSDRTIEVKEHIFIAGPAPKVTYAILTGDLHGQTGKTLPSHWHLGISTSNVRLSDFTSIGDDLWNVTNVTGRIIRLNGPKSIDGKQFIEREILVWLGAFMPVYSTGEIGIKRLSPVLSNSGYSIELNDTNIVSYTDLKHDYRDMINQIRIVWNHNFTADKYTKTSVLIDSASISKHNSSPLKEWKLFGVHTGEHTDKEINSYFNTIRDRYSAPPEKINVTILPSLNRLETGDTVRLKLNQISDFNDPKLTTIDRVFEVQGVQTNWMTGRVNLSLFGSSQKSATTTTTTLTSVIADSWYSSEGIELSTVLTISAGSITANGTLTGGATMSAGIYYYIGNLTINSGVTITITDNVEIRVMGTLTINGTINGIGGGLAGGAGATLFTATNATTMTYAQGLAAGYTFPYMSPQNRNVGTVGALGITSPGGRVFVSNPVASAQPFNANQTIGSVSSLYSYSVVNNSTSLSGMPTDLRGTSGGGGLTVYSLSGSTYTINANGGNGGNGGSGLVTISRGMAFGASGLIDTSGADGAAGGSFVKPSKGSILHAGSGGGGAPGGVVVFLDGNHTPPELDTFHNSYLGDSPITGTDLTTLGRQSSDQTQSGKHYSGIHGFQRYDYGSSANVLQYIPESGVASEEKDPPPPNVTNFIVGLSGDSVVFRWNEVIDNNLDGYEIRYTAQGVNDWDSGTVLTAAAKGTRITDTAINDGDWTFYIKAFDLAGQYSQAAATADASVVSPFDIIQESNEHPLWAGTLTNFVLHHTGKLIPKSQNLASADGWDTFDIAVINPYDICSYESSELDVGFDDTVRAWAETSGALMPSETGIVAITDYLDYKVAAGSYDGFEVWGVGEVLARYLKYKLELDTTQGVAYIDSQKIVADLLEREEKGLNVSVLATGLSVTFAQQYHTAPAVKIYMTGGGAIFPTASNITTTGFDIDIYNTSGTAVAGTVNWFSTGV